MVVAEDNSEQAQAAQSSADSRQHSIPAVLWAVAGCSPAVDIAAGDIHSLICLQNGTVVGCGSSEEGLQHNCYLRIPVAYTAAIYSPEV